MIVNGDDRLLQLVADITRAVSGVGAAAGPPSININLHNHNIRGNNYQNYGGASSAGSPASHEEMKKARKRSSKDNDA